MDGTRNFVLADHFHARLGTASGSIVLNVPRRNAFGADDRVIVSAVACDVACERQWLVGSRTGTPVAYRASGGELSGPQSPRCVRLASPEAILSGNAGGQRRGLRGANSARPR